ncbi:MAG TPA: SIS domain-containing protein [Anaerolineales bacterium]|nr:SIS domain-containing protein [Anaerolineales bacterium]
MSTHSEILEQPEILERLLKSQRAAVEEVANAMKARGVPFLFLAARGTSDNAGRYANYLLGGMNGLPLALATPSLFTYYQSPPHLDGAMVVGVSQSGQSPDIVSVLEEGKRQGCMTLGITNAPDSPLGRAADFVIDIQTGPELGVAATKTYTAELMAVAMLSAALDPKKISWEMLARVPAWLQQTIQHDQTIASAVERYRYMRQCVVLGRGYNYATAFEWALKMKELSYVEAEPYSPADFQHGPIAMVERGFPVMAMVAKGAVAESMIPMLKELRQDLLADLLVVSNVEQVLSLAKPSFAIAGDIPEALTPLVGIVPGQLMAYHLTLAKGYDPEKPRTIQKVTETR